jgi:hypothetical protein
MSLFSSTIQTALSGVTIRAANLVYLDFTSGPMRIWPGFGPLVAGGETWSGTNDLLSISGIETPIGGSAPETTLTLSGVNPDLIAAGLEASSEVKGRTAIVYLQFFDDAWQPLDSPYAVMTGVMDRMSIKATGPETRQVSVNVEWLFTRRAISPFGYLSDRDQRSLYAGDRGLEQMPAMQNKSVNWPIY